MNTNVGVCLPCFDMVHTDFALSLALMISYNTQVFPNVNPIIICRRDSIIHQSRHELIKSAIESKCEWVLFLDSDMGFPRDTLARLMDSKRYIIGCNYSTRNAPIKSTARDLNGVGLNQGKGIEEVSRLATGCLLINMKVFEELGEPYFDIEWDKEKKIFIGEDYTFCRKAKEKGYAICVDHDLSKEITHIGQHRF